MKETGEITSHGSLSGEKQYQRLAREALPILVRQAKAEQPMFYSDLATELHMLNARNLNYVLGTIGNALVELSKSWRMSIPPIQCLVINKKKRLPGAGIGWFVDDTKQFHRRSTKEQRLIILWMLSKVYNFEQWDDLLKYFSLQPLKTVSVRMKAGKSVGKFGGTGESDDHRSFKEFVAKHPELFGLSHTSGETEFLFGSADTIDVLFKNGECWHGIEVKSKKSGTDDIARGLFQCVKYKALIEATQVTEHLKPNSRIVLALESDLPHELVWLKNILGIEVIANLR